MNEPGPKEFEQAGLPGGEGGGESGGGAYPNPHSGKKPAKDSFMGSGGQSGMAYHGGGQLGGEAEGGNANAPARDESGTDEGRPKR